MDFFFVFCARAGRGECGLHGLSCLDRADRQAGIGQCKMVIINGQKSTQVYATWRAEGEPFGAQFIPPYLFSYNYWKSMALPLGCFAQVNKFCRNRKQVLL